MTKTLLPLELKQHIKLVTSRTNENVKKIRSLSLRKYRDAEGLFIAEGLCNVAEAIRHGWQLRTLVLETGMALNDQAVNAIQHCATHEGTCLEVSSGIMEHLAKRDNAHKVLAVFEQRWQSLSEVKMSLNSTWIALEEIRDPGNSGTIIRTAAAVGVEGIIMIGKACDPFSIESIRASAGSFTHMQFVKTSGTDFISWANSLQCQIIGTHLSAKTDYRAVDYKPPLLIIMGNEQSGLSDEVSGLCTNLVKIPMTGKTESLNISAAAAVMLYEAFRNRL